MGLIIAGSGSTFNRQHLITVVSASWIFETGAVIRLRERCHVERESVVPRDHSTKEVESEA